MPDVDADGDGTLNCNEQCPFDPLKIVAGDCGCNQPESTLDSDGDGVNDCLDECPLDQNRSVAGLCGCNEFEIDTDRDGTPDCHDNCPDDPFKSSPDQCGCNVPDADFDSDGTANCRDQCPADRHKTIPQVCGCGVDERDRDSDGTPDCIDLCPTDTTKVEPGICGCGVIESTDDDDGDGTTNCFDRCPINPSKIHPGLCGCFAPEDPTDTDTDGFPNCTDRCPTSPIKTLPGVCGCDIADTNSDLDAAPDCIDNCPFDSGKTEPGICGCGIPDTDRDGDAIPDCADACPIDPNKLAPGICGCGQLDIDGDNDGFLNCHESCPNNPAKTAPGVCGCDGLDTDIDGDGLLDCVDDCPVDPNKSSPGDCGCGELDFDTDGDGTADCDDSCPFDRSKTTPDMCGCGIADFLVKVGHNRGGFGVLNDNDNFGSATLEVGDWDQDNTVDLVVGHPGNDHEGSNRGAISVLYMNPSGYSLSNKTISSDTAGGFELLDHSAFGQALTTLGDLDADGVEDIIVGAPGDSTGGAGRGAVYVLLLNNDFTIKSHTKIADSLGGFGELADNDGFGTSLTVVDDFDGNGLPDIAVGAPGDDANGENRGAVYLVSLNTAGLAVTTQKIASGTIGLGALPEGVGFGTAVSYESNFAGLGAGLLAVGAPFTADGGSVYLLTLTASGVVTNTTILNKDSDGLESITSGDWFGASVAFHRDVDTDGIRDLLIGAPQYEAGGTSRGSVYVTLLNADGSIRFTERVTHYACRVGLLRDSDRFGSAVSPMRDFDFDNTPDMLVGSPFDDLGGVNRGSGYLVSVARAVQGDLCPDDPFKSDPGRCNCGTPEIDGDTDGVPDCVDECPLDREKHKIGLCGCGVSEADGDDDEIPDCVDEVQTGSKIWYSCDASNWNSYTTTISFYWSQLEVVFTPQAGGVHRTEIEVLNSSIFVNPSTPGAGPCSFVVAEPGQGITISYIDSEGVTRTFTIDASATSFQVIVGDEPAPFSMGLAAMSNGQEIRIVVDGQVVLVDDFSSTGSVTGITVRPVADTCASDPNKEKPGACGCGNPDTDGDGDGVADCIDQCPFDANKALAGICDCGVSDRDSDRDGTVDCNESCDQDRAKLVPGVCGCGKAELVNDADLDGTVDCLDSCPNDSQKLIPGSCGCGVSDAVTHLTAANAGFVSPVVEFGSSLASAGDLNQDGAEDLLIGMPSDDSGGSERGAVQISYLNALRTPLSVTKISSLTPGFGSIADGDAFGHSVANVGDINGDGSSDFAVGAPGSGSDDKGAVYLFLMSPLGDIASVAVISNAHPSLTGIPTAARFGSAVAGAGDTNGDAIPDILVGAPGAEAGGVAYLLRMRSDGGIKEVLVYGHQTPAIGSFQQEAGFATSMMGVGDLDDNGIDDIAIGAPQWQVNNRTTGAVVILLLEANGTIKNRKTITHFNDGFGSLRSGDAFGSSLASAGDIDGNGSRDIVVGASGTSGGGSNRGASYLLLMTQSGSVSSSSTLGNESCQIGARPDGSRLGQGLAVLGDADGDGSADLALGASSEVFFVSFAKTIPYDLCPNDSGKVDPGLCGCGVSESAGSNDQDSDGVTDCIDECPNNASKSGFGQCGCNGSEVDSDGDRLADCRDLCDNDSEKIEPGACGCGVSDSDNDGDGTANCLDQCPNEPLKSAGGQCGCGQPDVDSDDDGSADCVDGCASDPLKVLPLVCGCGVEDIDADGDGSADCIDECPSDTVKVLPGVCGCGVPDTDSDSDGTADCSDECDSDAFKVVAGICGCGLADSDTDNDGTLDCNDSCPSDGGKIVPGICGCGVADTDNDGDGALNCNDECPTDPAKTTPLQCGCGNAETDTDSDGVANCLDGCDEDSLKVSPGSCGCGNPETDDDGDGFANCIDNCPADNTKGAPGQCGCGTPDTDTDSDGVANCNDACPDHAVKTEPGVCGCVLSDVDSDGDGTPNCNDGCPGDAGKLEPGVCGCGQIDADSDSDGLADCADGCPLDALKITPGVCGCGVADTDSDGDSTPNCNDQCPSDAQKTQPLQCGCGNSETDSDSDGSADCIDQCPSDAFKVAPLFCGCGNAETDTDGDTTPDCVDACPNNPGKIVAGQCGCAELDTDSDNDGTADCNDQCPAHPGKIEPGICGCAIADTDTDNDSTPDCNDSCPNDPTKGVPGDCGCGVSEDDGDLDGVKNCNEECDLDPLKTEPGVCGCGVAEASGDADGDGTVDCQDNCPNDPAKGQPGVCGCGVPDTDSDSDGTPDCLDTCPSDSQKTAPGSCGCGISDEVIKYANGLRGLGNINTANVRFGRSVVELGDVDGDGVSDYAVGAVTTAGVGKVVILFMHANRTVKSITTIASSTSGFPAIGSDSLGISVAAPGDLSGDGIPDLLVGASSDDTGGTNRGAFYVLYLNSNGTVQSHKKLAQGLNGIGTLSNSDQFGHAISVIGDVDGDRIPDWGVTAVGDNGNRGALYVLFMNGDETVKSVSKIAHTLGNLGALNSGVAFGSSVTALGDSDSDGVPDVAVGSIYYDGGRGGFFTIRLTSQGFAKNATPLFSNTNGFPLISSLDRVGISIANIGDFDGNGVADVIVGAHEDNTGGTDRGAVYLVALSSSGSVIQSHKIASGLCSVGALINEASFGVAVGTIQGVNHRNMDVLVGAIGDSTGGISAGAVSVVSLANAITADLCPSDSSKVDPGFCGCGTVDSGDDADEDGFRDCIDECANDPSKSQVGSCGCGVAEIDDDADEIPNCIDECPTDVTKGVAGQCGCGVADTDSDADGTANCNDLCPTDAEKLAPGVCGCGVTDADVDGDGLPACSDGCPTDGGKSTPGACGCGVPDTNTDGDAAPDCNDGCPTDSNKTLPQVCGCGTPESDTDLDGTKDCQDACPMDPNKVLVGLCGCGVAEIDSDNDGTPNCNDECPSDPLKTVPGDCGCNTSDNDSDGDGTRDCEDDCPNDAIKAAPGICGCSVPDTDTDNDGTANCNDSCPSDTLKIQPGVCGCGVSDADSDQDGTLNCNDGCANDASKTAPGLCGCGLSDTNTDGDSQPNCLETCDNDPVKLEPGQCGCGNLDTDTDSDGTANCNDTCPNDALKTAPGVCGCGTPDIDSDGDGAADCNDECPNDSTKLYPGVCGCGQTCDEAPRITAPVEGASISNASVAITGVAPVFTLVEIRDNGTLLTTATSNNFGQWTVPSGVLVGAGTHALRVKSATSSLSTAVNVTITYNSGGILSPTNNSTVFSYNPRVCGFAPTSGSATISLNSVQQGVATANAAGAWCYTIPNRIAVGSNTIAATYRTSGNVVTNNDSVTVNLTLCQSGAFAGGDGSQANPFRISTCDQLLNMAQCTGSGFASLHYELTSNLNCSSVGTTVGIDGDFYGTLDGKGYELQNLSISSSGVDRGLFSRIVNGKVTSLIIKSASFSGSAATGSQGVLAGEISGATITNVAIRGTTFNATTNAGTLVGKAASSTLQKIFIANSTITATGQAIGGVIGLDRASNSLSTIGVSGLQITSAQDNVGGVIGLANIGAGSSITGVSVQGSTITSPNYTGGVVGQINVSSVFAIDEAYLRNITIGGSGSNKGGVAGEARNLSITDLDGVGITVNGSSTSNSVGGLVGHSLGTQARFERVSVQATLTGLHDVGGIVGWAEGNTTIRNAAATASLGSHGVVSHSRGGIAGYINSSGGSSAEISDSYSRISVSSCSSCDYVGGIVGYIQNGTGIVVQRVGTAGSIDARSYVGGIAGFHFSPAVVDTAISSVAVTNRGSYVGGIFGSRSGVNSAARNLFAFGSINNLGGTNARGAISGQITSTDVATNWVYDPALYAGHNCTWSTNLSTCIQATRGLYPIPTTPALNSSTANSIPPAQGTGERLETVRVHHSGLLVASPVVDGATGIWTAPESVFPGVGYYGVTAKTDTSYHSDPHFYGVHHTAGVLRRVNGVDVTSGSSVFGLRPEFCGLAPVYHRVEVLFNGVVNGSVQADLEGNWCYTAVSDFPSGAGTIGIKTYDLNGDLVSSADTSVQGGTCAPASFAGGTGSASDPLRISDCSQLQALNQCVGASFAATHFELSNSIDCSSVNPFSQLAKTDSFRGSLNGKGYSISNLTLNGGASSSPGGLFGSLSGARIRNLSLSGVTTTGATPSGPTGALASEATGSTVIDNVHLSGSSVVTGTSAVGGLVGSLSGSTLSNASVQNTTVTANGAGAGGVIGVVNTGAVLERLLSRSITVNTSGNNSGGLVGELSAASLRDSVVEGVSVSGALAVAGAAGVATDSTNIRNLSVQASVAAQGDLGGVIGILKNGSFIQSASAKVILNPSAGSDAVGGLVGRADGMSGSGVSLAELFVELTINGDATVTRCGGVAGEMNGNASSLSDSSVVGSVLCGNSSGGALGYLLGGSLEGIRTNVDLDGFNQAAVGGVVGQAAYLIGGSRSYSNLYAIGQVASTGNTVGGVFGVLDTAGTLELDQLSWDTASTGVGVCAGNVDPVENCSSSSMSATPLIISPATGSSFVDASPIINGTAAPNISVEIIDGVSLLATAVSDANGNWSVASGILQGSGFHLLRARTNGNQVSPPVSLTLSYTQGMVTTHADGSNFTSDRDTICGYGPSHMEVTVSLNGAIVGTAVADARGRWCHTFTAGLAEQTHLVSLSYRNPGGQVLNQQVLSITYEYCGALSFNGGSGTEASPYLIASENTFYNLKHCVGSRFDSRYFRITKDLDFSNLSRSPEVRGDFYGQLDGGGFEIAGVTIPVGMPYSGLFERLVSAEVENLVLVDFNSPSPGGVYSGGLLAGRASTSIVASVSVVDSSITGPTQIGGLIGRLDSGNLLQGVYLSSLTVNATGKHVGGVIGFDSGGNSLDSIGAQVLSIGSPSTDVGGIVGRVAGSSTYSNISIGNSSINSSDNGGGIAGTTIPSTGLVVIDEVLVADVSLAGGGSTKGGVVGYGHGLVLTDADVMSVTLLLSSTSIHLGCAAGWLQGAGAIVERVTAQCSISGNAYIGGLVGVQQGNAITRFSSARASITGLGTSINSLGGLVGHLRPDSGSSAELSDCQSITSITAAAANSRHLGGAVGYMLGSNVVVRRVHTSGSITAGDDSGGVVGLSIAPSIIDDVSSGVVVSGRNDVGGVIGERQGSNVGLSNIFADGSVSGSSIVGGAIGRTAESQALVNARWNSTSTGRSLCVGSNSGLACINTTRGATPTIINPADNSSQTNSWVAPSGTATAGQTVDIYRSGNLIASVVADGVGAWILPSSQGLGHGYHLFTAKVGTSYHSAARSYSVRYTEGRMTSPTSGTTVSLPRPQICGTAAPLHKVTISFDNSMAGMGRANIDGSWCITPSSDLLPGSNAIKVYMDTFAQVQLSDTSATLSYVP